MREIHLKLVRESIDTLIYEDGWWIEKSEMAKYMANKLGWTLDKNERTKELTLVALPHYWP